MMTEALAIGVAVGLIALSSGAAISMIILAAAYVKNMNSRQTDCDDGTEDAE